MRRENRRHLFDEYFRHPGRGLELLHRRGDQRRVGRRNGHIGWFCLPAGKLAEKFVRRHDGFLLPRLPFRILAIAAARSLIFAKIDLAAAGVEYWYYGSSAASRLHRN